MSDSYDARRYDGIIIGSGIGGGALATVLARAGKSVLVLEKSMVHRDRVRGEWMAPWGVVEAKTLGLYDDLIAAGGHHLTRHITYGDTREAHEAEATSLPLDALVPGIPGPLCIGHPAMCNLFERTARDAGASVLRGVTVDAMTFGAAPSVTYTHEGTQHTANARIIAGADGRGSRVREAAGIPLHQDTPHHLFAGLLVEDAHGWPDDTQAIGAEGDVHFLVFPQGNGRARLYLGYANEQAKRLAGDGGPQAFLDAFRLESMPGSEHLANATPAGPCSSYPNADSWTDEPFVEGCVLIGDAAGWNDPIIGQGLSITMRDVRTVRDVVLAGGLPDGKSWPASAFAAYATERAERMRRLRYSASIASTMLNEFGDEARERRRRAEARQREQPLLALSGLAALIGPENVPEVAFTEKMREQLFA